MSTHLQIRPLPRRPHAVRRFLRLSHALYRDDPHWVAPLMMDAQKIFSEANPLFEHAEMQLWVAVRNGTDVGRIAAVLDHTHNAVHRDHTTFFGFFESVNDPAVSQGLFDAVFAWTRQKGLRRVLGPMNPTGNEECGLLVDGFDSSPALMMPYNPPYYGGLIEAAGFRKAKDLFAYHIDLRDTPMPRLERLAERVRKKWPDLVFRPIARRTLDGDLTRLKQVYNAAWERNWGFVPMTDKEVDFLAARLRPLLHLPISWLVEKDGQTVGFLLALPDYNLVFKPLRGRLLTFRLLGALPYLLGRRHPHRARVITLGVVPDCRGMGLESVMLLEGLKVGFRAGMTEAEASWVLEDNVMMNRLMEVYGGRRYKTYRIYERDV